MSDKKVMLIDGNNYFSRMYYTVDREKENWLEEILNRFLTFREKFSDRRFVWTFDTCRSLRRLELYPEYKAKRLEGVEEEEKEKYRQSNLYFMEIIRACGFVTLEGHGYEADDYIACVAEMLKTRNHVIIVSTDKDLFQLIGTNVEVYEPSKMVTIDESNFESVMEIKKKFYLDYKCMVGDTSDNIPGIYGIGDKTAKKMIEEYGTLQEILNGIADKKVRSKKEQDVIANVPLLNRNRKLMSLKIPILDENLQFIIRDTIQNKTKSDKDKLHVLLGERKLGSAYKNFLRVCFV